MTSCWEFSGDSLMMLITYLISPRAAKSSLPQIDKHGISKRTKLQPERSVYQEFVLCKGYNFMLLWKRINWGIENEGNENVSHEDSHIHELENFNKISKENTCLLVDFSNETFGRECMNKQLLFSYRLAFKLKLAFRIKVFMMHVDLAILEQEAKVGKKFN